jgi:hypothetical protein
LGGLEPEVIVTPGLYVDRVVVRPEFIEEEEVERTAEAKKSYERFMERKGA